MLAYHRVEQPGTLDLAPTVIDAYPADFEAQMRYISGHYNVVSSWDVVRAIREGRSLPRRALVITFDDAYRSFADNALPVLKRLGLPVSLFVVTHFVDSPGTAFWWDSLYRALATTELAELAVPGMGRFLLTGPEERIAAYERLVELLERTEQAKMARTVESIVEQCAVQPSASNHILSWEEIRALAASGVNVGPHSRHHIVLSQADRTRARAEIAGSWRDLQARVPMALPIFCYPTGKPHAVNRAVARIVQEAGMSAAYTMVPGLNVIGRTNPYLLYRIGMLSGESLRKFAIKIGTTGRIYRKLKSIASPGARAQLNF